MNFNGFIKEYKQLNILKDAKLSISSIVSLTPYILEVVEAFFKEKYSLKELTFEVQEKLFIDFGVVFPEQVSKDILRKMISFEKTQISAGNKYLMLSDYLESLIAENKEDPHVFIKVYEAYKRFYGLSKFISKRDRTPFIITSKNFINIPDKNKVKEVFDYIESLDKKVYDNRFFRRYGKPNVLFVPGMGNGIYDSTDNIFVLPINMPRSYEDYIPPVFISYRWQLDSDWEFRSSYMTLPNYSKLNSKKLMQKMITDYKDWLFKEKKGYKVLTKEVREWISWQIAKEPIKKRKRTFASVKKDSSRSSNDEAQQEDELRVEKELNQITKTRTIRKLSPKEVLEIVKEGFASGEDLLAINNYYWDTVQKLVKVYKNSGKLTLQQKMFINFGLTYNINVNFPMDKIIIQDLTIFGFSDYIFKDLENVMDFEINDRIAILRKVMELSAKRDRAVYCPIMFKGQQLLDLDRAIELIRELIDDDHRMRKYRVIRKKGVPHILLAPGRANGFYFWESDVFILPIIPIRNTEESVYSMYALFKWENDEDLRNEYKMLKDIVKMNSLNSQRSFIKDLALWFSREKKGYKVLDKSRKSFFKRFFIRKETV